MILFTDARESLLKKGPAYTLHTNVPMDLSEPTIIAASRGSSQNADSWSSDIGLPRSPISQVKIENCRQQTGTVLQFEQRQLF